MSLNIKYFWVLDQIRIQHGIKKKDWARASRLPQSRVSELYKLLRLQNSGEVSGTVGRDFTVEKCRKLIEGLRELIGGEMLSKELLERLDTTKNEEEQNILMVLALGPGSKTLQANLFLKTLLQVNESKKAH